jgi:hypothetical protein
MKTTDQRRLTGLHAANLCWWLNQQNHDLANRLLTTANRAEPRDPDGWAARVLAVANQRGLAGERSILNVAEAIALAARPRAERESTASLGPSSNDVNHLRSLAMALHGGSAAPALPTGGAASSLDAPVVHLRTEPDARRAYNHPAHWISTADGKLAPDASRLHGHSARLWADLTTEFGAELAPTLFDAHVRGGALAVMAAMDAAGSKQRLTIDHLAALHFVALTDGSPSLWGRPDDQPVPDRNHDAAHAVTGFGVSRVEETYNNGAIEATIAASTLFDAGRPIAQQPQRVAELLESMKQGLAGLDFGPLSRITLTEEQLIGTPRQIAGDEEKRLQATGYLAHLDPQERESLRSTLYGPGRIQMGGMTIYSEDAPPTLEGIAVRYEQTGDRFRLDRELSAWSRRASDVLVAAARRHQMPDVDLQQSVARMFALKTCMTRNAACDLRVEFPRVLREVQQALGLPP